MGRSNFMIVVFVAAIICTTASAESIPVEHIQRQAHTSMVTRTESGTVIARHDFSQTVHGNEVTMHLTYRFVDGSIDDEETTFRQQGTFRLIRDRHIQKGPFFTKPVEFSIEAATGTATISTVDKNGNTHSQSRHIDLPEDLANGLVGVVLLNAPHNTGSFSVGMLAPVGGGRLIQILISPEGEQSFSMAGQNLKARVFRVHPQLGGIVGLLATLLGVQPKDVMVWVMEGEEPEVVKIVGQLGGYGPTVISQLDGTSFRK